MIIQIISAVIAIEFLFDYYKIGTKADVISHKLVR